MSSNASRSNHAPPSAVRRLLQVGLLIAIWFTTDSAARAFSLPIPGAVLGLAGLWVMLGLKWLPLSSVEYGADGLLEHLLLFFVPAMLGVLDHPEFISVVGVKLVLGVIVGTVIVMSGTAMMVELSFRWRARRNAD